MSLIKCNECGKEISNQATACPNCGFLIKPVLIEKTSKGWKLAKLISWLTFFFAIYIFAYGLKNGGFKNPATGLGFSLLFLAFIGIIVSKFGAWWNHK